jgi:CHASE2 domain-containing sensor protein
MSRAGPVSNRKARFAAVWTSPYWAQLYRAKWVILGIAFITFLLSHAGLFDRFETAGLDAFNILKSPADPTHVVIIGIDDEDYTSLFEETSPLKSAALERLLAAIAKGHPQVIGVDLDTSSKHSEAIETHPDWPAIVWGRDAIWNDKTRTFRVLPVLGGRDPARNLDMVGIAQLPLDSDGIVRRYHRHFPIEGGGKADSFPWAVVQAACAKPHPMEGCDAVKKDIASSKRGLVLNFAGERFNFTPLAARFLLQAAEQPGWKTTSPLRDQIVLLGGFYRAARDMQVTPVGPMQGVQLMAQAIETEFGGGGIHPLNEFLAILLDLLSGALVVYINYRYPLHPGQAMLLSLIGLLILPLISSYLAFSTLARWLNFVPIIVGVLLHQLYEHGREYHHLRELYPQMEHSQASGDPHHQAS